MTMAFKPISLACIVLVWGSVVKAQVEQIEQARKTQREVIEKTSFIPPATNLQDKRDTFIVKFIEGSKIRFRKKRLIVDTAHIDMAERYLLNRNNLNQEAAPESLDSFLLLLKKYGDVKISRLFNRTETDIDVEQKVLEDTINEELPDLNLYYVLSIRYYKGRNSFNFLDLLNSLNIIETAYPKYHVKNAGINLIPNAAALRRFPSYIKTPDFSASQKFLTASPLGIDALYAWSIDGGNGDNVKIIDIEQKWDIKHEDVKSPFWKNGEDIESGGEPDGDHGTAVIGLLNGKHDSIGIKGIVPGSSYGISGVTVDISSHGYLVSVAIDKAASQLSKGDIILIEQHTPGPASGKGSICNIDQFEYVPMEFYQDCYDAIKRATAKGIIVIEAAGNGQMNLDDKIYNKRFNRKFRNSGAIMVAADQGGNGVPACFTNYGSRIDFYSWGENVTTTGYGDLPNEERNLHRKYTGTFGGTSSASPIVTGAIACIQGIRKKFGLSPWGTTDIIAGMAGTFQVADSTSNFRFIGRQPDLKATIQQFNLKKPAKPVFSEPSGEYPSPFTFTIGNRLFESVSDTGELGLHTFYITNANVLTENNNSTMYKEPVTINNAKDEDLVVSIIAKSFFTPKNSQVKIEGDTALATYIVYKQPIGPSPTQASTELKDSIVLNWAGQANAQKYFIYINKADSLIKVAEVSAPATQFIDITAPGTGLERTYRIKTIFNNNRESAFSDPVTGRFRIVPAGN